MEALALLGVERCEEHVHGRYLTDLLPSFILIGLGIGVSFVAVTVAALAGVPGRDAGVAAGLVNTARQVGGAVGLAAVTTLATIYAGHRSVHESLAAGATHGYRVAFATLGVLALVGAILTTTMRVRRPDIQVIETASETLAEAA